MLRALGVGLLAAGGLALGLERARELGRRMELLSALEAALRLMDSELALRCPATPELLTVLARRAPETVRELFRQCGADLERLGEVPFEEIWAEAVGRLPALAGEDRRSLTRLGALLGRYDAQAQRRGIEQVCRELEQTLSLLDERRRREGKAYAALGLCLGLFAAVALL